LRVYHRHFTSNRALLVKVSGSYTNLPSKSPNVNQVDWFVDFNRTLV
jgi:hypothetical protein